MIMGNMDINTLEKSFVEKDPEGRVDFGGIWRSDKTGEIIATIYVDDQARVYFRNGSPSLAFSMVVMQRLPDWHSLLRSMLPGYRS